MMSKWIKVFSLFVILHGIGWGGAHWWMSRHEHTLLIVVDTSFALKPSFPAMQRWIKERVAKGRYEIVLVGTDKASLGELSDLPSTEALFRTAFGRSEPASLARYASIESDERIFLSDGRFEPPGWELVRFTKP